MESLLKIIDKREAGSDQYPPMISDKFYANKTQPFIPPKRKRRLLVQKGIENIALLLENIVLIYTQDKLVYVLDKFSVKYICNKTLSELQQELDTATFFRANRQYIVNINFIRSFKTFEKVKLLVNITIPEINHRIIISQEAAPFFRKWIEEA